MSSINIRKVQSGDLSLLRALSISTFVETFGDQNTPEDMQNYVCKSFSETHLSQELENPNSEFYFAVFNREIVGYLKLNTGDAQTDDKLPNALEIERIYIKSGFQGKSFGKELFQFALDQAKDQKRDWLWLGVWDQNKKAIAFYEHHGLEVFDGHAFKLGNDLQQDLLMKLPI